MLTHSILTLLALGLSAVTAHPITKRQAGITPDTATCDRSEVNGGALRASFRVNIARPYIDGAGCRDINREINTALSPNDGIAEYKCEDNGTGGTFLSFTSETDRFTNYAVIDGLQKAYPMVPFQKERLCLQSGAPVPDYWPS